MKKYNKWIFNVASGLALTSVIATSCVDEIKFGNSFLEKAPGGSVTKDTVFNNAEYTRQFLTNLYGMQYYGLPYKNVANQESSNQYVGKPEALTDLYVFTYPSCGISGPYYKGTHTANYGKRSDKFDYLRNNVWEAVRGVWMLIENIDNVPGLGEDEKASMVAQAKCILASRYFDVFRHYGGIPLIKGTFSGTDTSYEMPRNSVEETVNYMVQLLDEAAAVLPWTVETPASESGRWTRAAALAYKCRILQFAASPLFNSDQPYYPGATGNPAIWYGGYKPELWDRCLEACEQFFNELASKGGYSLQQAKGTRPEDYRLAYRAGYANLDSPEVLINTRVIDIDAFKSSHYNWHQWGDPLMKIHRGYSPTQEWPDGALRQAAPRLPQRMAQLAAQLRRQLWRRQRSPAVERPCPLAEYHRSPRGRPCGRKQYFQLRLQHPATEYAGSHQRRGSGADGYGQPDQGRYAHGAGRGLPDLL